MSKQPTLFLRLTLAFVPGKQFNICLRWLNIYPKKLLFQGVCWKLGFQHQLLGHLQCSSCHVSLFIIWTFWLIDWLNLCIDRPRNAVLLCSNPWSIYCEERHCWCFMMLLQVFSAKEAAFSWRQCNSLQAINIMFISYIKTNSVLWLIPVYACIESLYHLKS